MKKTLPILLFLIFTGILAGQLKISQYPNTNALGPNQLFLVTAGGTNMNVKTSDMPGALGVPTLSILYSVGANGTNFTYSIGANGTNFTYSIGANGTNFAYALALACSNLAYQIGAAATNNTIAHSNFNAFSANGGVISNDLFVLGAMHMATLYVNDLVVTTSVAAASASFTNLVSTNASFGTLRGLLSVSNAANSQRHSYVDDGEGWQFFYGGDQWTFDPAASSGIPHRYEMTNQIGGVSSNGVVYKATNINFVGNTKMTNANGTMSVDVTPGAGSSPTTTPGDTIFRGTSADERLPIGNGGSIYTVVQGTNATAYPDWLDTSDGCFISDNFLQYITLSAGLQSVGGHFANSSGGAASTTFIGTPSLSRLYSRRNGWAQLKLYPTNNTTPLAYMASFAGTTPVWRMNSNFCWEATICFEVGGFTNTSTNMLWQGGILASRSSSNQTAGAFFEIAQGDGAVLGSTNALVCKCVGATTNSYVTLLTGAYPDKSFDSLLTNIISLKIAGDTNTIVFYTNGVPCWTNDTQTAMPVNTVLYPSAFILNQMTQFPNPNSATNLQFWCDRVNFYERFKPKP